MTLPDTPEAMRAHIEREGVIASPLTSFLGLEVIRCWDGTCELGLTVRPELTQSHRTLHGGVLSSLADIVCGFAAVSQCGAVVTANVPTHMLGPAQIGDRVRAIATVKRAGKRQVVVTADFHTSNGSKEKLIVTASATLVRIRPPPA